MASRVVYSADELRVHDRVDVHMGWRSQMVSFSHPEAWALTVDGGMGAKGVVTKIEQRTFGGNPRSSVELTVVHVDDGEHVWPIIDPGLDGDFSATILPLEARTLRCGKNY